MDDQTGRDQGNKLGDGASEKTVGDYALLEELGRSGLGIVYRARHLSSNRLVALRVISADEFAGPQQLHQFRAEAEATVRLDHPGIVRVYEFGEAQGCFYLATALIEGTSLQERVRRDGPLSAAEAARLMKSLTEAIAYAHRREITHRDLKPSNVLLNEQETPLVSGFGLARPLTANEAAPFARQVPATPAYLSPEQVGGESTVDQHTDTYSLGAILYFALTGRPPFQAATAVRTLEQVYEFAPAPPRSLNPDIPPDLETIALKCLEKEPERRYAWAQTLAEDLDRFVNGQPILARPESATKRLLAWAGWPVVASLTALLFIAALVWAIVSTNLATERQTALKQSRNEYARAENARAELRSELADLRASIVKSISAIATEDALREERLRPVIKLLLARTLEYYENYVDTHDGVHDVSTRYDLGQAYLGIAQIHEVSGDTKEAILAYEESISLQRHYGLQPSDREDYRFDLAMTCLQVGKLYRDTGSYVEARQWFDEGAELLQQLRGARPDEAKYQLQFALSHKAIGALRHEMGNRYDAESELGLASHVLGDLIDKHPFVDEYRDQQADVLDQLGVIHLEGGSRLRAFEVGQAALRLRQALVENSPNNDAYRFKLASSHANYGNFLRDGENILGVADLDGAIQHYDNALQLLKQLSEDHPTISLYPANLARVHTEVALAHEKQRELVAAADSYETARAAQEQLAEEQPDVTRFQSDLIDTNTRLGKVYERQERPKDALAAFTRGVEIAERLTEEHVDEERFALSLADVLRGRGAFHRSVTGNDSSAIADFDRAIRILDKANEKVPRRQQVKSLLLAAHLEQAAAYEATNAWHEVVKELEQAVELAEWNAQEEVRADLAVAIARSGDYRSAVSMAHRVLRDANLDYDFARKGMALKAASSFALSAIAVTNDMEIAAEERARLAEQYEISAFIVLQKLQGLNYFDTEEQLKLLEDNDAFDVLRQREGFQRLFGRAPAVR